ncbi:head GIN domain-containing protein [Egibacter rhizosphaerae]|uniref:head GIN domain-containing protein n=1 Tax=Egibacter rhizosphaerae TaxID=1670831 RepID=UPI0013F14E15|nr:head GIN domain-containing protein [Egibacter rhizosphaerae]
MRVTLLLLIVGALLVGGCTVPRASLGPEESHSVPVTDVDALRVSGGTTVEVTLGEEPSLELSGPRRSLRRVTVEVEGDRLSIRPGRTFWWGDAGHIRATLTLPDLAAIDASGAAEVDVAGDLEGHGVDVRASGASDVRAGVTASTTQVRAGGASSIALVGESGDLEARASGSSTLDLGAFETERAAVEASGSSDVAVQTLEELDIEASGASSVEYAGDPGVRQNLSGASEARPTASRSDR